MYPPTHNGKDYHHKVKDIPANCEEVAAEGKNLDEAFTGEDEDKDQVDLVEDGLHAFRLLIRLHHHGHHVDYDEHHDYYVKGLLGHQVKEEALNHVLGLINTEIVISAHKCMITPHVGFIVIQCPDYTVFISTNKLYHIHINTYQGCWNISSPWVLE